MCHLEDVNSRGDANFAIEFLGSGENRSGDYVVTRTVVTDSASGDFESCVLSYWVIGQDKKLASCKEVLIGTLDSESCGDNQDPRDWPSVVTV